MHALVCPLWRRTEDLSGVRDGLTVPSSMVLHTVALHILDMELSLLPIVFSRRPLPLSALADPGQRVNVTYPGLIS